MPNAGSVQLFQSRIEVTHRKEIVVRLGIRGRVDRSPVVPFPTVSVGRQKLPPMTGKDAGRRLHLCSSATKSFLNVGFPARNTSLGKVQT